MRSMFETHSDRLPILIGLVGMAVFMGWVYWHSVRDEAPMAAVTPTSAAKPLELSAMQVQVVAPKENLDFARKEQPIATVFECIINGQRVFSDSPCGTKVKVHEIAQPNLMKAQSTGPTHEIPQEVLRLQPHQVRQIEAIKPQVSNKSLCRQIEAEIESINARMRQGYTSRQGEWYRERLRQLDNRLHELRC